MFQKAHIPPGMDLHNYVQIYEDIVQLMILLAWEIDSNGYANTNYIAGE